MLSSLMHQEVGTHCERCLVLSTNVLAEGTLPLRVERFTLNEEFSEQEKEEKSSIDNYQAVAIMCL